MVLYFIKINWWCPRILFSFQNYLGICVLPRGDHLGSFWIYKRISALVFWEGLKKDVRTFIQACEVCQRNKYDALWPAKLMQPLLIPTQVKEDIIEGLLKSHDFDTIMVVVDWLTKYSHFTPLWHPYTIKQVVELFVHDIVRLHEFPRTIVSDHDCVFLSTFWIELF